MCRKILIDHTYNIVDLTWQIIASAMKQSNDTMNVVAAEWQTKGANTIHGIIFS
jgi:hypothetical protein